MGNAPVKSFDESGDQFAEFDGIETLGYRVLGVQPNSPAADAGLVSFFDFLVGANGEMLLGSGEELQEGEEYDDIDFPALLMEHKDKVVELLVWNIKAQEKRLVELTPNDAWGGAGLLGVTIKLDDYGGADERLIRVLEVEADSPAAQAGLVPMKDFLLGTTATAFSSAQVLSSVLLDHVDHVVEIYVYNSDSDMVRVVALMPTYSWGGRGLLGAEVGTGYLHRLPTSCRESIGKSMERKVRLLDGKGAAGELSQEGAAAGAPLEMEPHLEMEVEKDEDNQYINPEGVTKQPHELGSPAEKSARQAKQPQVPMRQPQFEETHQSPPTATATEPRGDRKSSLPPFPEAAPVASSLDPLPAPPVLSSTDAAADAGAIFAGPPPGAKGAVSDPVSSLPAPPKMHY